LAGSDKMISKMMAVMKSHLTDLKFLKMLKRSGLDMQP
jgi:hypothetical protein